MWRVRAAFLGLVVLAVVVALGQGLDKTGTHEEILGVSEALGDFYADFVLEHGDIRRLGTMVALDAEILNELSAMFSLLDTQVDEVHRKFRGAVRRAPELRRAEKSFQGVVQLCRSVVANGHAAVNDTMPYMPRDPEAFLLQYDGLDRSAAATLRPQYEHALKQARRQLDLIASESAKTSFASFTVASLIAVAALGCMHVLLSRAFRDTKMQLAAREKLARQQAHEQRNRLAPALLMLETMLAGDAPNDRQVASALSLLREVEMLHRARLDCYKIMRGNYKLAMETFDLVAFMRARLDAESAIAKCKDPQYSVDFAFDTESKHAIHVRCDHYVLNHVVSNLLSNARKFTTHGSVTVSFLGRRDDLLVLRVRDTGQGIPADICEQLFRSEVATGDLRGTGLGLPSCYLFCEAAKGYAKLVSTSTNGDTGTTFEFAILGNVVSVEDSFVEVVTESKALPDDVHVVVVDDSGMNRRAVVNSLTKVSKHWTFAEYPTVEAAQPELGTLRGPHNIVVLDNNMASKGGVKTGTDAIHWLNSVGYQGCIISASGDTEIGHYHTTIGAHFAWGKPVPQTPKILAHLAEHFA